METTPNKTIIIIGAGIAGLSMGIYAQMNGYKSHIFELHTLPGGLMTAWKRKGYTVDGCIHWLTGSSKEYGYSRYWDEIGIINDVEIFNPEVFYRIEGKNGEVLNLYTNVDKLQQHMLEIAPEDRKVILQFCGAIRKFGKWNPSVDDTTLDKAKSIIPIALVMPELIQWGRLSMADLGAKFTNPFLRDSFSTLWFPEMSSVGILVTLAMLNKKGAGYPMGGSLPMALAVEKRYLSLGGQIHYSSRVEKILVENDKAVGIRLTDGTETRGDIVVSAADGHATLFEMLDKKYIDNTFRDLYENGKAFPALLHIGLGVDRQFPELEGMTSGLSIEFHEPFEIAGDQITRLETMIYNFDPSLAPAGKTAMIVMLPSSYEYWKEISTDSERYDSEKKNVAMHVIQHLNKRFPGLEGQVEMIDVATPLTFEKYTGNWKGSFEGWLPTPSAMMKQIPNTLTGLGNFYMVGQWVQPGGGLPSGVMTARKVIKKICEQHGVRFKTTTI